MPVRSRAFQALSVGFQFELALARAKPRAKECVPHKDRWQIYRLVSVVCRSSLYCRNFTLWLIENSIPKAAKKLQYCPTGLRRADMAISPEDDGEKAIKLFEKLGVCRQLAEAAVSLGWKTPTSIQEQAVPHLLAGVGEILAPYVTEQCHVPTPKRPCNDGLLISCRRQRRHWSCTNWVWKDWRLCYANPAGQRVSEVFLSQLHDALRMQKIGICADQKSRNIAASN